ncbi:MAG: ATP-binding cassette domain-containing protein [Nitrospirae bacterium]|nr:ATP-binding cassette domain-containing protein [Nitrospirota bacterium]
MKDPGKRRSGRCLVDIVNADVSLGGRRILEGVSWQLKEGEHWAVSGGNGAGKSTFLKLIRGDLWPDPETRGLRMYAFNGERQQSPIGIKQHIALISPEGQDVYFRNGLDLTGEEVICTGFSDSLWLYERPRADRAEYAEEIIELLKAGGLRKKSILMMSEGEARRVLIARALVARPRLLLLDEFCSGLDIISRKEMLCLIDGIAQKGTQIIATTHRTGELIPSISHVLCLEQGRVVRQGKSEEVLSRAKLRGGTGNAPSGIREVAGGPLPGRRMPNGKRASLVEIKNVDLFLDQRKILEGINWNIRRDENWAVLGRNGAGKSSLLKLIQGHLHPAPGGVVRRFGKAGGEDLRELRKRIGSLSSELQGTYDYDLTGEEVVRSGFFSSIGLYDEVSRRQKAIAGKWIRFFGAEGLCGKNIFSMSYGELRKILVIRTMVNDPDLLILDEPCSGLDVPARAGFFAMLERLSGTGTGIILVTHHPEDLIPSVTHVLVMDEGRIIAGGRKEKVLGMKDVSALFGDLHR